MAVRSVRNNNPGNIRISNTPWVGKIDNPNESSFETFATPELGVRAMTKNLYSYQNRGLSSVNDMIYTWAPPSENDSAGYASRVAAAMGVDPNTPINLSQNPQLAAKMIDAMILEEGGREAQDYFSSHVNGGIAMANGTLDPNFTPEDPPPTDDVEEDIDNEDEETVEDAVEEEEERVPPVGVRLPIFQENVLNRFESYTYNWTIYMIPPEKAHRLDENLQAGEYVVIAQSGVEAEIAINNVRQELVMSPAHHRDAFATTFSFELIEPLGVTLITRLVEACQRLGIKSFQEATYLLELNFKGWDSDGNAIDNIVGPYYYGTKIVGWQARYTDGATMYAVEFINTGQEFDKHLHSAIAEDITSLTATTFGEFIEKLEVELNRIEKNKSLLSNSRLFQDFYELEITGEVDWANWAFGAVTSEDNETANITVTGSGTLTFMFKSGTKITDAIGTALLNTEEFRKLPVYNELKSKKSAKANGTDGEADHIAMADLLTWYTLDSNVTYRTWDVLAAQYTKNMKLTVKPFIGPEIRHDPVSTQKLQSDKSLQTKRLNKLAEAELLRKRYDYTYTGLNTEVMDLDVTLDNTFYTIQALQHGALTSRSDFFVGVEKRLVDLQTELNNTRSQLRKKQNELTRLENEQFDPRPEGDRRRAENAREQAELREEIEAINTQVDTSLSVLGEEQDKIQALKDQQTQPSRNLSFEQRYITQQDIANKDTTVEAFPDKFNQTKFRSLATGGSSEEDGPAAAMLGAVEQNYTAFADMLSQVMTVRGDPYWLGRPKNQKSLRNRTQHANYQKGGVCYFLNLQFPTFPNNDTGLMDLSQRNFGIIGIYRVMTVTANYNDGMFTMQLSSIRDLHSNMEAIYEQLHEGYYTTTRRQLPLSPGGL
jgi:hypothetical protein